MPEHSTRSSRPPCTVLALSKNGVEWFDRDAKGRTHYGAGIPSGTRPADLVQAAVEARRSSGKRRRTCVVALDHTLSRHQLMPVPDIPRKELARVFERKALKFMDGGEGKIAFDARPMGRVETEGGQESLQNWLVVALQSDFMRDTLLRLRSHGFRVRRVVSRSLGALCSAREAIGGGTEPFIAVTVDREVTTVTLARGDELVYRDRIEGDFSNDPALPTSVVQLVRSCAAFWRKRSRGETLEKVVLLGLNPEQGELLSHAITAAVGGGEVIVLPEADDGAMSGRHRFLEATCGTGACCPDMSVPLPAHGPLAAVLIAVFLVTTGTMAWIIHGNSSNDLRNVQLDTAALNTRVAEMSRHEDERRSIDAGVALLDGHLARTVEIGNHGVDLDRLLGAAAAAFEGRAELDDVAVNTTGEGTRVLILRGSMNPDPKRVLAVLEDISGDLSARPGIGAVTMDLPRQLAGGAGGFTFTLEAELGGTR